jgi:phosphatidylinositol alpha 1,6-mannosyltransferase
MKIAYFIGTLRKEDGVTTILLHLIQEARKKGIESIIITGWAQDTSISPVPVIQVPSVMFPFYREYRLSIPGIHGFEKKLNEFKPDVIHLQSPDTIGWAGLKYAKKYNIPIIATFNTNFIKYLVYYHAAFLSSFFKSILRKLYNQMALVTTPSSVTTEELKADKIKNVETVSWGVDFTKFNPSFRSEEWRQKILKGKLGKILLCVCRLTWEKDLRTLAEAYQMLKKKRDDFAMVIAGEGPNQKELESLMPGAVFLGHIEGKELSEAYASSDILLFPSSTETFGNVTVEAMAAGIIPIVANAGGSKSLVKEGETGFLAEPKNARDFYEKTNALLDDPDLQQKIRAADLEFVKDFSWEKVFSRFMEIYQRLLK